MWIVSDHERWKFNNYLVKGFTLLFICTGLFGYCNCKFIYLMKFIIYLKFMYDEVQENGNFPLLHVNKIFLFKTFLRAFRFLVFNYTVDEVNLI